MPKGVPNKIYSGQFKVKVVDTMYAEHLSCPEEARRFSIQSETQVARWESIYIRYYLCIQSLALLKQRYPDPEMILSNCGSMLYLGSTELEMLKELETKLGTTRVTPDGSEKPLCSQAELMTLVKAFRPACMQILQKRVSHYV